MSAFSWAVFFGVFLSRLAVAQSPCDALFLPAVNIQIQQELKSQWPAASALFERKFLKSITPAYEEFIEELGEEALSEKTKGNPTLKGLLDQALLAAKKMKEMREAMETIRPEEKQYFLHSFQAAWVSLIKHLDVYSHGSLKKLDVPRLMAILREIQSFNSKTAEYSYYRIKRSIEGRYALKEFLFCK